MNSLPRPASFAPSRRRPVAFSCFRFAVSALALAPMAILPSGYALPAGAQVAAGHVSIAQAGAAMTLTQASRNAIVNWQSFNIGAGERLRIQQSGADAAMLARVIGNDPSKLMGSLQADGKLFLINPKGVIVGQGATIDTAAFMASTLDVSDADFLRGTAMTFQGDSDASVVNLGQITAHEGNVMLFARSVKNAGEIHAPKGTAALAAGNEVYAGTANDASFVIKLNLPDGSKPAGDAQVGVENSGVIDAAQAELKAAGGSFYDLAVNQSGIVRATGIETKNGRILLTADGGDVTVSGAMIANNADGSGGEILVGGDLHGANASVPNATRTVVTETATLDASATTETARSGRAIVWADDTTTFRGRLKARGAAGGFAEISGKRFLDFRPVSTIDLGRDGNLLLDPDAIVVAEADPNFSGVSWIDVATLQDQLETTDVTLDAGNGFNFSAPVAWNSAHALTATSAGDIRVNKDITAPNGTLALYAGKAAFVPDGNGDHITPQVRLSPLASITADRLVLGSNPNALPSGWTLEGNTSPADLAGNLTVGTLEVDLANGATGVETSGSDNTIGTFRTSGTGDLTKAVVTNNHGDLAVKLVSANSSATDVRVTTPGDLTLQAGSSLSFADPTDVVLASTGGAFTNQAGASVFGANASYQIYSSTTAATTKDGLAGSNVFNTTYDSDNPSGGASGENRFFYTAASGSPVLTYTADDGSRRYGAADPTFGFTVTGFDDNIANDVTGTPALSTAATQSSGVGFYDILISQGTLVSTNNNYAFSFVPGTLTIERAPLTITADDTGRKLNRNNPSFTASYSGLVNGDTSAVVSGLQFETPATTSSAEGDYTITPFGASAANYSINYATGTLTIAGIATLAIKADDASRTYGSPNPAFTASITGFEDGENSSVVSGLNFSTSATQSSGVGSYTITPFGASAPGYDITYASGTLTIERASLTITPNSKSRVYGDPNNLTASFSGLVNGDTESVVSGLTFNTDATQSSGVGSYRVTLSGGTADNYAVNTSGSATLTINPATISVKLDDKTRVYGDANPAFTYSVLGLKNGDSPSSAVLFGVGPTSFAGDQAAVGTYEIFGNAVSGSPNYTLASVINGTLSVTKRPLTITAENKTKVYGDPFPTYTATFNGLASFDSPSAISGLTFALPAGVKDGVQTVGIFPSGGANPNYDITFKSGLLTITPAMLQLAALPDLIRVYGRENPAVPEIKPETLGLKNGDTVASLGLGFSFPVPTADVGTYDYTITQRNPNYAVPANGGGKFHVTPAPLDVQIGSTGRLYGDETPTVALHASGLAFGQTADAVLTLLDPTSPRSEVGVYQLGVEAASPNYTINAVTGGRLQVNPRLITLGIDNVAKYYGDPTPPFTATAGGDGLAPFDNEFAVISGYKTAVPVDAATDVGLYRIDPIFAPNPNYHVRLSSGYLAILQRPIELTINNSVIFGGNNVPPGFTTEGTGVDLLTYDENGKERGFTATATNLPPNVLLKDVFPEFDFQILPENTPQPVAGVVDLAQVFAPATSAPPAEGSADDFPEPAAPGTITLSHIEVPTLLPPLDFKPEVTAVIGGKLVKNPSEVEKVLDQHKDVLLYVVPKNAINKNYAVTKITAGVLTQKVDPVLLQTRLDAALLADQRRLAKESFEHVGLGQTAAFGLPPELFPILRQALGLAADADLQSGNTGPGSLYYELAGDDYLFTGDQAQSDKFLFWLADIHSNPLKQAQLLPVLLDFALRAAGRPANEVSDLDRAFLAYMEPFVQKAQEKFAKQLQAEKEAWLQKQASVEGAANFMLGGTDMFTEVISGAVENVTKDSTAKLNGVIEDLVDEAKTTLTDNVLDTANQDVKSLLTYSAQVAVGGAVIAAGGPLGKELRANNTALWDMKKMIDEALGDARDNFSRGLESKLKTGGEAITSESHGLESRAAQQIWTKIENEYAKPEVAESLQKAYDDAYAKNIAEGMKSSEAKQAALAAQGEAKNKILAEISEKATREGTEEFGLRLQELDDFKKSPELEERGLKAAQEAFDKALAEGKTANQANEIAEVAKAEEIQKAVSQKVRTLESFEDLNTSKEALEAFKKSPELEELGRKAGSDALDKALAQGKSADEATEIAEKAKANAIQEAINQKADAEGLGDSFKVKADQLTAFKQSPELEEQGLKAAQQAFDQALSEGKTATQANEIAEKAKAVAIEKAVQEKAESIGAKIGTKTGEAALEDLISKSGQIGAKLGVEGGVRATAGVARAASLGARAASLAKSLVFGPAAIIDLVLQIGITAATSAAERAEQEARLDKLIASGSNPVDLHAMATDENSRAVLMMGLLEMFNTPTP